MLESRFLGVSVLVWVVILFGFLWMIILGFLIFKEVLLEWFRSKYYKFRWPERAIKLCIFFPNKIKKTYWRLIPDSDSFMLNGLKYFYREDEIIKENDFYVRPDQDTEHLIAVVDGKKYYITDQFKIKGRFDKYPELHYFYNNPFAIDYSKIGDDDPRATTSFSSALYQELAKNDLIRKLLTLQGEKTILMVVIVIVIINLVMTMALVAKVFNLIHTK